MKLRQARKVRKRAFKQLWTDPTKHKISTLRKAFKKR